MISLCCTGSLKDVSNLLKSVDVLLQGGVIPNVDYLLYCYVCVCVCVCVAINNHPSQLIEEIKSETTTKEQQLRIVSINILSHLLIGTN